MITTEQLAVMMKISRQAVWQKVERLGLKPAMLVRGAALWDDKQVAQMMRPMPEKPAAKAPRKRVAVVKRHRRTRAKARA